MLATLAACASAPWAEVSGERIGRADPHYEGVRIKAVDGRAILPPTELERIEPGQRMVVLASKRRNEMAERATRSPFGAAASEALAPLNAKPCMRYIFAAKHASMSQLEPWELELAKVEPMPDCLAKFPQAAPAAAPASAASASAASR